MTTFIEVRQSEPARASCDSCNWGISGSPAGMVAFYAKQHRRTHEETKTTKTGSFRSCCASFNGKPHEAHCHTVKKA